MRPLVERGKRLEQHVPVHPAAAHVVGLAPCVGHLGRQAWRRGVPTVSFFDPDGLIRRLGLGHAATSLYDMAAAVQRLTHNPDAWRAASARCRQFMDTHYGDDTVLRPYLEALRG